MHKITEALKEKLKKKRKTLKQQKIKKNNRKKNQTNTGKLQYF